jgi:hypothetical protein
MLPKIDGKKCGQEYYPKLLAGSSNDETILKLKIIQQFLEEDSYTARPTPLQHRKQFSLHTYRHNNQENLKKYVSNTSNELPPNANPRKENLPPRKEDVPRREVRSRPQTKRECIRLNELVEGVQREKEGVLLRK